MSILRKAILALLAILGLAVFLVGHASAQEKSIVAASTTEPKDTGLFHYLLPLFKEKTGITVKVLALGTGIALDAARMGEADVVFTHYKLAEQAFVAEDDGVKRYPVMYNDFVLIGPKNDPAGIKGMRDIAKALKAIKDKQAVFISRGDHSGTHLTELALWKTDVGINIEEESWPLYKPTGWGTMATLHMASAKDGYVLSDRGAWISCDRKGDLEIMVEGDKRLSNQYAVILVNPAKHPNVKKELGQQFIDWLVSPEGQKAIADYKIDGKQLFYPDATLSVFQVR